MLFKELVKRKKFEINNCIEVDIAPLNGWKDWFLTEEDKVKDIHKTKYRIYLNSLLITEGEVPINFRSIKCKTHIKVGSFFTIDHWRFEIPEMHIWSKRDLTITSLSSGSEINTTFEFKIGRD